MNSESASSRNGGGNPEGNLPQNPKSSLGHLLLQALGRELQLLKYGVFGWFRGDFVPDQKTTFSAYRESGWATFLAGLLVMFGFESIGVQIFLRSGHPWLAYAHTVLAIYGGLWLLGDFQTIKKSGVALRPQELRVRLGLRWDFAIPYSNVTSVHEGEPAELSAPLELKVGKFIVFSKAEGYAALTVMGKANLYLTLRQPMRVDGWLGRRKTLTRVGLSVDQSEKFIAALRTQLTK